MCIRDSTSVNFGTAVGHGTIRIAAMGFADRKPEAKEMHLMKSILRQSLQEGAFAMTTGLIYPPGCYADTQELIELSDGYKRQVSGSAAS